MGYDTEGQADLSGFTDLAQVSTYAREAMAWCVDAGLLSGTSPTTLSPAARRPGPKQRLY
ncbi:MAG: S-layer homology domain-containing protein [Evtepia gabavorous]